MTEETSTLPLPYAFGPPPCRGVIRSVADDFQVDEILGFEGDGEGEHQLLHIEKRDTNTDWVAGVLARYAGVSRADVSYAGLKDRHALTRQWFSIRLAGREAPDWDALGESSMRVLEQVRHSKKLRIGALKGNRFRIRVRGLEGETAALEARLQSIAAQGVPNYFGEQRFGSNSANLGSARRLFEGRLKRIKRQKRGFYLSAARALLFNRVLAARVTDQTWNNLLPGERMMLDGTRSSFLAAEIDPDLLARHVAMDVHPSGPLWGRGGSMVAEQVEALEQQVLQDDRFWCDGLERFGLKMERRALRVPVSGLQWTFDGDWVELAFFLPKGCFATVVLRECVDYRAAIPDLTSAAVPEE